MGENTLRALASDLAYLTAWSLAATSWPLPWPAPEALVLKFIAHHLWDPAKRESDAAHGMPDAVERALRAQGVLRASSPHLTGQGLCDKALPATTRQWPSLRRVGLKPRFCLP